MHPQPLAHMGPVIQQMLKYIGGTSMLSQEHTGCGHDHASQIGQYMELKSEFWLKLTLCDTPTRYIIIIIFIMGGYGT